MEKATMEAFASKEHEKWGHWMRYLFRQSEAQSDGSVVIPKALVERWQQQARTAYADLSESEKESDRKVVQGFFGELIDKTVRGAFDG